MSQPLTLGYSPCPNDTYIFYALVHHKVAVPGIEVRERLEDVETLNRLAMNGALDLTKVSYHAFGRLRSSYALLRSGGALGRGCGPLIVARPGATLDDLAAGTVAVPGTLTTAYLLLRLFAPRVTDIAVMPFDRILKAVADGKVSAGLIIHESRFTYPLYGLTSLADLGHWWEDHSRLPLPLGGILGKRSLGPEILGAVERAIRESLRYARQHEAEVLAYCRRHSQEMDESVMRSHIDLYVNSFTDDLGAEGVAAVRRFLREGEEAGLFPASPEEIFAAPQGPV
jgi:1,4-dihydroxy-6-naphthoate synthase